MGVRAAALARLRTFGALAVGGIVLAAPGIGRAEGRVNVGSKAFPESWILGDALAATMRSRGVADVEHRRNLGGTEIVLKALQSGSIDVYPEYTGTIREVLLHEPPEYREAHRDTPIDSLRDGLARMGLQVSGPIGFDDSYAIAVTPEAARRYGLGTLSDLASHPEVRLGLTHEFLGRQDGFPGLAALYGLPRRNITGIQHELAYTALASGKIDGTDIYTTDAQIARLHLVVLKDDRAFFPRYDAVWLYRADLPARNPHAMEAIRRLTNAVSQDRMIRANARVVLGGMESSVAAESLLAEIGVGRTSGAAAGTGPAVRTAAGTAASIAKNTLQHMKLVALSLLAAVLAGVPLGIAAARSRWIGGAVLAATGLAQTIPSLALLAVLIPLLGIGVVPALVALFIYSLLPIVRNTYVGLTTIPPPLLESAACLPLSARRQLTSIRLPLASPAILAGIRTSAVINVGSATLAALIGAGGLGEPILSGIQLRRNDLILQGAIPAALLALLVERGFDWVDRALIPRGLRIAPATGWNGRRRTPRRSTIMGGSNVEATHDPDAPIERNP